MSLNIDHYQTVTLKNRKNLDNVATLMNLFSKYLFNVLVNLQATFLDWKACFKWFTWSWITNAVAHLFLFLP